MQRCLHGSTDDPAAHLLYCLQADEYLVMAKASSNGPGGMCSVQTP
jgi:hypothetical protein